MKKRVQGFICGILTGLVLFMCIPVFAQTAQTIQAYFNRLNLKINGEMVAKAGQTFTLHDDRKVPYTILYQDTTYLPLREMCRLLDKDIEYDGATGTISITDKTDTKEPENGTADKGGGIVSEQQYVTHKELAAFIVKSFGLKDKGIRYNIEGIEQNDPYYIDLCIVLSYGIYGDPSNFKYFPSVLTRTHLAYLICNNILLLDTNMIKPDKNIIKDIDTINWAQSVMTAIHYGFMELYPDGTFRGYEPLTLPLEPRTDYLDIMKQYNLEFKFNQ